MLLVSPHLTCRDDVQTQPVSGGQLSSESQETGWWGRCSGGATVGLDLELFAFFCTSVSYSVT